MAFAVYELVGGRVFLAAGGYALRAPWLDRAAGAITAAVLVIIGALVATSVI